MKYSVTFIDNQTPPFTREKTEIYVDYPLSIEEAEDLLLEQLQSQEFFVEWVQVRTLTLIDNTPAAVGYLEYCLFLE